MAVGFLISPKTSEYLTVTPRNSILETLFKTSDVCAKNCRCRKVVGYPNIRHLKKKLQQFSKIICCLCMWISENVRFTDRRKVFTKTAEGFRNELDIYRATFRFFAALDIVISTHEMRKA